VAYDLAGEIKLIQEAKTFDSGFTKREMVVIVEDGKYPQEINIEFVQDMVSLLDSLQPGQEVTFTLISVVGSTTEDTSTIFRAGRSRFKEMKAHLLQQDNHLCRPMLPHLTSTTTSRSDAE
jgi:hypothetical protein